MSEWTTISNQGALITFLKTGSHNMATSSSFMNRLPQVTVTIENVEGMLRSLWQMLRNIERRSSCMKGGRPEQSS